MQRKIACCNSGRRAAAEVEACQHAAGLGRAAGLEAILLPQLLLVCQLVSIAGLGVLQARKVHLQAAGGMGRVVAPLNTVSSASCGPQAEFGSTLPADCHFFPPRLTMSCRTLWA